ncbi:PD-(D/E)XK nuclease family protein [bacterium]|nr:PD-(D/E)XK nuclease family protein [bacterium]
MAKEEVIGVWTKVRETAKALLLARQDGYEQWFPKSVVEGPNTEGELKIEEWFLGKNPLSPMREGPPLVAPQRTRGEWKKGATSFSKAKGFLACPRNYHFSYERTIPFVDSQALHVGTLVHDAIERVFDCDFSLASPPQWVDHIVRTQWSKKKSQFETAKRSRGRWDDRKETSAIDQALWALDRITQGRMTAEGLERAMPTHREVAAFSKDGKVGGYIDYAQENKEGTLLVDFKSGGCSPPVEGLPPDHALQGQIYAHLAEEMWGALPKRVEFWYTAHDHVEGFAPDKKEADAIGLMIREAGAEISRLSGKPEASFEANPHPETCNWCDAKPWCKPYQEMALETPWRSEGFGKAIKGKVKVSNPLRGNRPGSARLSTLDGGEILVKGWDAAGKRLGQTKTGEEVTVLDVKVEHSDFSGDLEATTYDPYAVLIDGKSIPL